MKWLQRIFGSIMVIMAIFIMLITSFEIGIYSDFGWYEKEYEKYQVIEDLQMDMEDVMDVTEEMMAYLRGNREDLVVNTVVNGTEREFFNDREKAHMVDVQNLFLGGLKLRRWAIVLFAAAFVLLIAAKGKPRKLLSTYFLRGVAVFIGITGGLGILFATDFNRYFTLFHEIFFDNDLWLLDPATDLMIRMLPEGFFFDMVIRIGAIFLVMLAVIVAVCIYDLKKQKNKGSL